MMKYTNTHLDHRLYEWVKQIAIHSVVLVHTHTFAFLYCICTVYKTMQSTHLIINCYCFARDNVRSIVIQ